MKPDTWWFYITPEDVKTGPVGLNDIRQMVASGDLSPDVPVWRNGMDTYRPFPEALTWDHCSACRRLLPGADLARFGDQLVCPDCKLLVLQRYEETGHLIAGAGAAWRDGHRIIVPRPDAELPRRCFHCNHPATTSTILESVHLRHGPTRATLWLCERHRRGFRGLRNAVQAVGRFPLIAVPILVAAAYAIPAAREWISFTFLLWMVLGVFLSTRGPAIHARSRDYAHLTGAGPAFLNSLPKWE